MREAEILLSKVPRGFVRKRWQVPKLLDSITLGYLTDSRPLWWAGEDPVDDRIITDLTARPARSDLPAWALVSARC